jgi:riboflavin transporter FmnP
MGFLSYGDLLSETTDQGKLAAFPFIKVGTAPQAAGAFHTYWLASGFPGAGSAPATTPGTQYTNAAGSFNVADTSPDSKHLLSMSVTANQNCTVWLMDRLVGVSGLSLVGTGNKTVSSAALPRYTNGVGVMPFLEITTATTTTPAQLSMNSYTNSAGTSGQAGGTVTLPAAATVVNTMIALPLAAGDVGIQACSTINVSVAAAAGVANFILARPIGDPIGCVANIATMVDYSVGFAGMKRVYDGASLFLMIVAGGTSATTLTGTINIGWG